MITLEDPIEYLHRHNQSVVTQREIGLDTESYVTGPSRSLRQAPDVILVGEMRDEETIKTALTAAETGHLVISTLHTVGAANTIDRIIDSFPPAQQEQVRAQLSMVMQAVVSQQLIPKVEGGVAPAFEVMFFNNAIRNLIRESRSTRSTISSLPPRRRHDHHGQQHHKAVPGRKRSVKENAIIYSSNGELMGEETGKTVKEEIDAKKAPFGQCDPGGARRLFFIYQNTDKKQRINVNNHFFFPNKCNSSRKIEDIFFEK